MQSRCYGGHQNSFGCVVPACKCPFYRIENSRIDEASRYFVWKNRWVGRNVSLRSEQGDQTWIKPLLDEANRLADSMEDTGRRARAKALSHHTQAIVAFRERDIERAIAESSKSIAILQEMENKIGAASSIPVSNTWMSTVDGGEKITDDYLADAFINLSVMLGEPHFTRRKLSDSSRRSMQFDGSGASINPLVASSVQLEKPMRITSDPLSYILTNDKKADLIEVQKATRFRC